MTKLIIVFTVLLMFTAILHAEEKIGNIQSKTLAQREQQIRPYAINQTEEAFVRTVHGGVQHVVAKSPENTAQIKLIQAHLLKIAGQFKNGDFSVTERMHGADMPGLAQLKRAKPDEIKFEYRALKNGGQIHYSSEYPQFVAALHEWFDAQASEHGSQDIAGHNRHHLSNSE